MPDVPAPKTPPPPAAPPKPVAAQPKPSLAAKLAEIMGAMAHIPKEGFNTSQKYRFVRETDVAEKASELLAERHVWIHQTVIKEKMQPLYTTMSGSQMWLTKVWIDFHFIDGDSGEVTAPQTFVGYGADTGDKGVYKAMTGAEKYFLMKSFLVSTGDDPEADEKVDKAADAAGAATGAPRVVRGSQSGVKRGGRSDIATKAQADEIVRLLKELNLTSAATAYPIVQATLGHIPSEDQKFSQFLAELKSEEAAKLIAAFMEFKPVEKVDDDEEVVHTESTDVDEDDRPPAMAVV